MHGWPRKIAAQPSESSFLFQPVHALTNRLSSRFREAFGRRATGIIVTVLIEGLFLLLLLTLGRSASYDETVPATNLTSFEVGPEPDESTGAEPSQQAAQQPRPPEPKPPEPEQPPEPQPTETTRPTVRITPREMAAADISKIPSSPRPSSRTSQSTYGPPTRGKTPGDTPRVAGSAPNGEPLYAASWYREPYESEMAGYLSTASGPGWGQIACRTVPNYRVEDCVIVGEYPRGSNIAHAVLAAAWQFKVRPPRVGGRLKIGAWVQIRIMWN